MCIDWEQLNTGNCHQNADLQKVEQTLVKSASSWQYGFVDAAQERLRRVSCPAWAFVSPWELSPHSTLVDNAALQHVERYENDWTTLLRQLLPELKQMLTKHTQTAQPLPTIVCYRSKAFTKRGQGQDFPL